MHSHITAFQIRGLYGRRDVNIPIIDDCVILVGVNGLGKTTIINLFFYLITRQWTKLAEYDFESLSLTVGGEQLTITKAQLEAYGFGTRWRRRLARISPRLLRDFEAQPHLIRELVESPSALARVSRQLGAPASLINQVRHTLMEDTPQQALFESTAELKELGERLEERLGLDVIYLPTYRRIERDLEKIFPGLDEQIRELRKLRRQKSSRYLEFVEFGMQDVEARFEELFEQLRERARQELNRLAASYLGEVIRGEAETYETSVIASLDDDTIERIFNRVEERDILNEPDKATLRRLISRLRSPGGSAVAPRERYVGHFFAKLAVIHKSLTEAEGAIGAFVNVCNEYLDDKRIVFDERKYSLQIEHERGGETIAMSKLSSGEKQIVSLFTHVYLGDASSLSVLIDEPELSLSVPWQRRLLPDIKMSKRCKFLAAVTHSPFIFENGLASYATDLKQCISER